MQNIKYKMKNAFDAVLINAAGIVNNLNDHSF